MFGNLFKRKISSEKAAEIYMQILFEWLHDSWDKDVETINQLAGLSSEIDSDDGNVFMNFYLICIALELRAVINISLARYGSVSFSIYDTLREIEGFGEAAVQIVQDQFLPAMRRSERDGLPHVEGALDVLFQMMNWSRNPMSGTVVLSVIAPKLGIWKKITEKYKIA